MKTRYFNRFKSFINRIFHPEIFIVASIVRIYNDRENYTDIEVETEYYTNILGLFKNLEIAEELAIDLKNNNNYGCFTSKYFFDKYGIDVDCLQPYDDIVIFSLPLHREK